jgi:hypothetical protein
LRRDVDAAGRTPQRAQHREVHGVTVPACGPCVTGV